MTWVLPHPLVDYSIEILARAQWTGPQVSDLNHVIRMIGDKAYGPSGGTRIHLWAEHDLFEPSHAVAGKPKHYSFVMWLLEVIGNTPGVDYYIITPHTNILCDALEQTFGRPTLDNLIVGVPFVGHTDIYLHSMAAIGRVSPACRFMITTPEMLFRVDERIEMFEYKPPATQYFIGDVAKWDASWVHEDCISTLRVQDATDWLVVVGESIHDDGPPIVDHMRHERRVAYAGPYSKNPVLFGHARIVDSPPVRRETRFGRRGDRSRVDIALKELMVMQYQYDCTVERMRSMGQAVQDYKDAKKDAADEDTGV